MGRNDLPGEVRSLVARCLASVEHLEALLLLEKDGSRWWSPQEVADELRTSSSSARRRLEELGAFNLLDVRIGQDVLYRYAPGDAGLSRTVESLRRCYQEQRVAVLSEILARPAHAIIDFADAFRLGKGRHDA